MSQNTSNPNVLAEFLRGRGWRGRLWADGRFGSVDVSESWPAVPTPLSRWINRCGGIVFDVADLPIVAQYPGIITDGALTRIELPAKEGK